MELKIGKGSYLTGLTLPDQSRFVFSCGLEMAIKAVVGRVDQTFLEPLGVGFLPIQNCLPWLEPIEFGCLI